MAILENLKRLIGALLSEFREHRPPWKARSVRWAALLVLFGAALAVWSALGSGETGVDARTWPWPARVGLSYIGGFTIGWFMRRFAKLTLLALLAAIVGFSLLRQLSFIDVDWDAGRDATTGALRDLRGGADTLSRALKSSLPSAGAVGLGGLAGFFYRVREVREAPADA